MENSGEQNLFEDFRGLTSERDISQVIQRFWGLDLWYWCNEFDFPLLGIDSSPEAFIEEFSPILHKNRQIPLYDAGGEIPREV